MADNNFFFKVFAELSDTEYKTNTGYGMGAEDELSEASEASVPDGADESISETSPSMEKVDKMRILSDYVTENKSREGAELVRVTARLEADDIDEAGEASETSDADGAGGEIPEMSPSLEKAATEENASMSDCEAKNMAGVGAEVVRVTARPEADNDVEEGVRKMR